MLSIKIDDIELFSDADFSPLAPFKIVKSGSCDVLCVGIRRLIDDNYIKDLIGLRWILSPSTAIDHVTAKDVNIIKLIPNRIKNITAASEFVVLLSLVGLRKFNSILHGKQVVGEDIFGKTVGILGFGRIGKRISKVFKKIGANVIWHDRVKGVSKQEVLQKSDLVIILVSAVEENRNFISYDDFKKMKRCPFFINISRGFIVNEEALLVALENKQISGAALDVVTQKSMFERYMSNNDNLIITPHLSGTTMQSRKKACDFVIKELAEKL